MSKTGCFNAAGFLLSCIGCLLTMMPYIGIIFLPLSLLGSLLVLASSLDTRSKVVLVLFPYVVPVALYIIIWVVLP
jgi:hypothetical protein